LLLVLGCIFGGVKVFKPYPFPGISCTINKDVEHGRPSPFAELNILSVSDMLGYESSVC